MKRRSNKQTNLHILWLVSFSSLFIVTDSSYGDILDNINNSYYSASMGWASKLSGIAQSLFLKLALIELAWSSIVWALQQDQLSSFTAALVKKIMGIGFFYALLTSANSWIPAIINSMASAGGAATGLPALSPSYIFDTGVFTASTMLAGIKASSAIANFAAAIVGGLAALLTVIAFAIVACQLLITQIESYIAIGGGILFLGFGASRWTVDFAQKYISFAFATGVKIFLMYLIISVGMNEAKTWANLLSTINTENVFAVMGGALLFCYLSIHVPSMASALLSGSPALTAGGAFGAGAAVGAAVVAGGATAISSTIQSARGGAQAIGAAYSHHRAAGGGIGSSTTKAMGTAAADYGSEAIRSIGQTLGFANPSMSNHGSIGGRAAETREMKTAEMLEKRAASGETGNIVPPQQSERVSTKPFESLKNIRPPQLPNDSAPSAGVNIRLGHTED